MKLKISLMHLFFLSMPCLLFAQTNEQISITTYYPSPYGVYSMLRLNPRTDISPGNPCSNEGEMAYLDDPTNQVYVCSGSPLQWRLAQSVWTLTGTNLYPNDNNWKVGIGTTTPGSKLEVSSSGPTELTIQGASADYINAGLTLKATADANFRGLGVFMHDAGGDNEWYAGRPYGASDRYVIGRKASVPNHAISTSAKENALVTVDNSGNVGIGTGATAPAYKLDVSGDIRGTNVRGTSVCIGGVCRSTWPTLSIDYNQCDWAPGAAAWKYCYCDSGYKAIGWTGYNCINRAGDWGCYRTWYYPDRIGFWHDGNATAYTQVICAKLQ